MLEIGGMFGHIYGGMFGHIEYGAMMLFKSLCENNFASLTDQSITINTRKIKSFLLSACQRGAYFFHPHSSITNGSICVFLFLFFDPMVVEFFSWMHNRKDPINQETK